MIRGVLEAGKLSVWLSTRNREKAKKNSFVIPAQWE